MGGVSEEWGDCQELAQKTVCSVWLETRLKGRLELEPICAVFLITGWDDINFLKVLIICWPIDSRSALDLCWRSLVVRRSPEGHV